MQLLFTASNSCFSELFFFFCLFLSVLPFTELKDLGRIKPLSSCLRAFITSTVNKGFSNKTFVGEHFVCKIGCGHLYMS